MKMDGFHWGSYQRTYFTLLGTGRGPPCGFSHQRKKGKQEILKSNIDPTKRVVDTCEPRTKTLITFRYTGLLIGILLMVYYNPYIPG